MLQFYEMMVRNLTDNNAIHKKIYSREIMYVYYRFEKHY